MKIKVVSKCLFQVGFLVLFLFCGCSPYGTTTRHGIKLYDNVIEEISIETETTFIVSYFSSYFDPHSIYDSLHHVDVRIWDTIESSLCGARAISCIYNYPTLSRIHIGPVTPYDAFGHELGHFILYRFTDLKEEDHHDWMCENGFPRWGSCSE